MPSTALVIGTAAAKAVIKLWLKDHAVAVDLSSSLVDIVVSKLPGERAQRRAVRSFERLAEDIADRLAPFIDVELHGLPKHEQEAACYAVAQALDNTPITDDLLFTADMESLEIERAVRRAAGDITRKALLSEPAAALFDRLLSEASAYIVAVAVSLPTFSERAAVEMLRRESETHQMLTDVLARMPAADPTRAPDEAEFELRYRRSVVLKLDTLELFGLSVSESTRRYTLTVAYISLTSTGVSKSPAFDAPAPHSKRTRQRPEDSENGYVRVEEVLAGTSRAVIRGGAGSGKTTLLQWIAVRSASRALGESLAAWGNSVPFYIPLRRYVGKELPRPEDFLDHTSRNISGVMPPGWVHRVLASGQGLVLIDGVDELPESERAKARRWLGDLTEEFPDSRYVVTSRPAAVGAAWLSEFEFQDSELQPMTLTDISAFIDHWHTAVSEGADDDTRAELDGMRGRLTGVIRDTPHLRNLATSPLLCAMLCALNRDRRTQLPRDRLELYRISLETLLDRRDVEREVLGDGTILSLPEKEILLRSFAHWLMLNDQTDADREAAVSCIGRRLEGMPNLAGVGTAEQLFARLLERSGLLREPVVGRIDFVHRTFQEYLAAIEIVEQDSIGMLIERGQQDQWREVVILAAGHAREGERVRLIKGLLDRGNQRPQVRHRLHLLAVACLETSRQLPSTLVETLKQTLQALVPPRNLTEARALASAGDLAVPLLANFVSAKATTAAACIRALALIGTPEALETLAQFASDRRLTVSRALLRAWSYFDPARYADTVLADCVLDRGHVTITDLSLVPFVPRLRRAASVTIQARRRLPSLQVLLPVADRIRVLDMGGSTRVSDFGWLTEFVGLRYLDASHSGLSSLQPLRNLSLRYLDVSGTPVSDLMPLASHSIKTLRASGSRVEDLSSLEGHSSLEVLEVAGTKVSSLDPISRVETLREVRCGYTSIDHLTLGSHVRNVSAPGTAIRSLDDLSMSDLHDLDVSQCSELESLGFLERAQGLWRLDVSMCPMLHELDALSSLTSLRWLEVRSSEPASWGFLAGLNGLRTLDLARSPSFSDPSPLFGMTRLSWLGLAGTGIEDFEFLKSLPNLRYLSVDARIEPKQIRQHLEQRVHVRRVRLHFVSSTPDFYT